MEPQPAPGRQDSFREVLKEAVTPVTWQTWLEPLRVENDGNGSIRVVAPSEFHLRWVEDKHFDTVRDAAHRAFGTHTDVILEASHEPVLDEFEDETPEPQPAETTGHSGPAADGDDSPLLAKYQFNNFVVGPSNRFANAAAMAVSEQPGTRYNPLFIYGKAGLGKTHLLHSVGHNGRYLYPRLVVQYVTSEAFFNDFIDGIRRKRMDEFKARYRNIDILLLDDVQFFEGKEQILEEFFHTFNSLHEAGKQMVISSDRHPKHLSTLEDRLRSRFEWGLLTDIQPPDVETRLAILRRNAELAPLQVPQTVLEFIASHVLDNIRELEGALTRVTAYAALTGQEIDLDMASDVLQDLVPQKDSRPLTVEEIIHAASSSFSVPADDLVGPSRKQPLALARQVAMYLCRELTDLSLPRIGQNFGNRDHTTVMHAVDRVKKLMQSDQRIFDQVTALSQSLRRT